MEEMDEMTIVELVKGTKQVYIETEQKKAPEIDKHALKKLLQAKPPLDFKENLETVWVRCDRMTGRWVQCDEEGVPVKGHTCAVLVDVELNSVLRAFGCGGDFTGFAKGLKLSAKKPVSVPKSHVRHLVYNRLEGVFTDSKTNKVVTKVDYLILKPHCQHDYISGEEGESK